MPATALQPDAFWDAFTRILVNARNQSPCTAEIDASIPEHAGNLQASYTIKVRDCTHPENAVPTWGSLYDALYNDTLIPHTAGLKPGNAINAARRDRVVRFGKDFLDKTFPLTEGSHRDAVSYMVYFQNLLVILADGSTTGLQHPKQFVGKNGPSESPDTILLEHNGIHTEVLFDQDGITGTNDLASIEDIQLESSAHTLFEFTADSVSEKCTVFSNWLALVSNRSGKILSDRNGEQTSIEHRNWTVASPLAASPTTVARYDNGDPVPEALVDTLTAALIESAHSEGLSCLNVVVDTSEGTSDSFIEELLKLIPTTTQKHGGMPRDTQIKAFAQPADILAQRYNRSCTATSTIDEAAYPVTATIGALQSHGYDIARATSI